MINMYSYFKPLFLMTLLLFLLKTSYCQLKEWNGGVTGDWNVANNWIPIGVPTSTDSVRLSGAVTVMVPVGTFSIKYLNTNATELILSNGSTLNIINTKGFSSLNRVNNKGIINIQGDTSSTPSVRWSNLVNTGTIIIKDVQFVSSTGTVENRGDISYSSSSSLLKSESWSNSAKFENFGLWCVKNMNADGIVNSDTVINYNTGLIRVDSIDAQILDFGFQNSEFLHNMGRVEIKGVTDFGSGLYNIDSILNEGMILIENTESSSHGNVHNVGGIENRDSIVIINNTGFNGNGIYNEIGAVFNNASTGVITIDSINGIQNVAIENDGLFNNHGKVKVKHQPERFGLFNRGDFHNYKEIDFFEMTTSSAFAIRNDGFLTNFSDGRVQIYDVVGGSLENRGTLLNQGELIFDRYSGGLAISNKNFGLIQNDSLIAISENLDNSAAIFNDVNCEIRNDTSGIIEISNIHFSGSNGVAISNGSTIKNDGQITLKDMSSLQSAFGNGGSNCEVINSGLIEIIKVDGIAFSIINAKDFTNDLSGKVIIDSVSEHNSAIGMQVSNTPFNNEGDIYISNILSNSFNASGIICGGDSTSTNNGTIRITNSVDQAIFLEAGHEFYNSQCAEITTNSPFRFIGNAIFENEGLVHQTDTVVNVIFNGQFNNRGLYIDRGGSSLSDLAVNEGIYINEFDEMLSCNDTLSQFYQGTNSVGITSSDSIFNDSLKTQAIGTVDVLTKQIVFNVLADNASKTYVDFELPGACRKIVPLYYESNISCPNTLIWTGNQSNQWFNPNNWNLLRIPNSLDEVVIGSGSIVVISGGIDAEARILSIENNVDFTVNGILSVEGN